MSNSYKIESLNDFLKIPVSRLDVFFDEFKDAIKMHHAIIDEIGIDPDSAELHPIVWTDDGLGEIKGNT